MVLSGVEGKFSACRHRESVFHIENEALICLVRCSREARSSAVVYACAPECNELTRGKNERPLHVRHHRRMNNAQGLRSIAFSSIACGRGRRPRISVRNVSETDASGEELKSGVPEATASARRRSILWWARLSTGCALTAPMSTRSSGSVLIILWISFSSSGELSRLIWLKSSCRRRCQASPL